MEAPHLRVPAGNNTRRIRVEREILAKNGALAADNRAWLAARGITALNVMSSPGAGKTTLLERALGALAARMPVGVVQGDQATSLDAERIRAVGVPAVQVNTGTGCHLDAEMVRRAATELALPAGSVLVIENVGNLVCPALFDLGEDARVVLASVPEGDDKPAKYPTAFAAADLVVLNKIDLLPYVRFDVGAFERRLRGVRPGAAVLHVSATRGDGVADFVAWIAARVAARG